MATSGWVDANPQQAREAASQELLPDVATPVQLMDQCEDMHDRGEVGLGALEMPNGNAASSASRPTSSGGVLRAWGESEFSVPATTVASKVSDLPPVAEDTAPRKPMPSQQEGGNDASVPQTPAKPSRSVSYVPGLDSPTDERRTANSGNSVTISKGSMRYLSGALARSFTHARHIVAGDDDTVHDKWDTWDDEVDAEENEAIARMRGASMSVLRAASGKVVPLPQPQQRQLSGVPVAEVLNEKGSTRVLLWGYFQALMFSVLVSAVCIPLITVLSLVNWHTDVDGMVVMTNATTAAVPDHPHNRGTVIPNHVALQWMLLAQIVFPLIIYAVALFMSIRRSFRIPLPLAGIVVFTLSWSLLVCGLFYHFDVAFWFYYIDLFMIVAAYVPCMCMVGWLIDETASTKSRLWDVFYTALLETIVAAATLVYCLFLMPLFFSMRSAWLQMLWLTVLHPLYFELTTGFIVRKILHRNRAMGRTHVVYFLTIVHSMVHTVALGTSLQASIEPVRVLALTVFLYNLSKLTWRSTVIQRDLLVERVFKGWSFNYSQEDLAELSRMVSVGIITEIILENASIFITPYLMYRMYKEPIFMAVVPNTFFTNGGTYPVQTLIVLIVILLGFTTVFDLIFYFLNYHTWQCLPLINTWRRIKRSQGWYLLFLIYAFACMGIFFLFLTMMMLPRAAYCKSNNYCDCVTIGYDNICEGRFNSVMGDYVIDPN